MKDEDNEATVYRRFEISRRHRLLQLASCQVETYSLIGDEFWY